jgi:hypothetical protein
MIRGNRSRYSVSRRQSVVVAVTVACAACGSSERDSADARAADAPRSSVLRVARDGDDAGDGTAQPVATLRRALGLALQHPEITDIELAAGRYELGDASDHSVPTTVKRLAGPPGGGAILVGTGAESRTIALVVRAGRIEDLALESFATAIRVEGSATIANVRVAGSGAAIRGQYFRGRDEDGDLKVQIDNLDVSRGDVPPGGCVIGVALDRPAELTLTGFAARGVDLAFQAPFDVTAAPSRVDISAANITSPGDLTACNAAVLELGASAFTMRDSVVEGGVFAVNSYDDAVVAIKNSTFRNQGIAFIGGGTFELTDTMITGTGTALSPSAGTWSLAGVTITGNRTGIDFNGFRPKPLTVALRRCDVSRNTGDGIELSGNVDADLGTVAAPGNNVITANGDVGLNVVAATGTNTAPPRITAVGNTWNASRQDADGDGRYIVVGTLDGPIAAAAGNNFALVSGTSVQR